MIPTLVVLGATGDLARRFLFPALGALRDTGRLPDDFRLLGGARTRLDDDGFGKLVGDALPRDRVAYRVVDLADPSSIAAAVARSPHPVAVYLAVPPGVVATTIESLCGAGLAPGSRVVVEKPFGDDLDSAKALNGLLARACGDAYRVDHVLGMAPTRNLVALRRHNPTLDGLWNGERIEQVDVLWEETLALEGRAGFYDQAGALKDVLQNHMLQLLALVAMDVPDDDDDVHDRKLDALTNVRLATPGRRARYAAGTLADGRAVPAYAHEDGVDPARGTETFAEVAFEIDTARWRGTRFVLRTGKALAQRRKLVSLHFRDGNELEVGIDGPRDVVLRLRDAEGAPFELRGPVHDDGLSPYAHVLLDVLAGTSALSVSGDEAEQGWRIVTPVLQRWDEGEVPLEEYAAGSAGPA